MSLPAACIPIDEPLRVLEIRAARIGPPTRRPMMFAPIHAGFPSPGEDFYEKPLDLNEHLQVRRNSTFFMRVEGDSMEGARIYSGDILLVDRAHRAKDGDVVVVRVADQLTVKRLRMSNGQAWFAAENPRFEAIKADDGCEIWGVVTWSVHRPA
jgi:DNA polymerase V